MTKDRVAAVIAMTLTGIVAMILVGVGIDKAMDKIMFNNE